MTASLKEDSLTTSSARDGSMSVKTLSSSEKVSPVEDQEVVEQEGEEVHVYYKPPRRQFLLILVALSVSMFLASLDAIIVSTAIPAISDEFGALMDISWIGTAYLLATTAIQPIYGKFSDIFGRMSAMLSANLFFIFGSAISGWATSMTMLILGRAFAGIGAGGMIAMVFIILSDMLDMRERGKYMGIVGAMNALASVLGPLLGGIFVDELTWRWALWINLPLCGVSSLFIFFCLKLPTPSGTFTEKVKRIDFLGSGVLVVAVVLLLFPLNWGGTRYEWGSGIIIGLLCASVLMVAVFIWVEWKIPKEPIIPIHLFKIRNILATFLALCFSGMSFYGLAFFLPIYFQIIKGESAMIGGLETIPFLMGMVLSAIGSGIWVLKRGTYVFFPALGNALFTIGSALTLLFLRNTHRAITVLILFLCGFGFGCSLQIPTLVVQAASKPKYMATVTALVQFVRYLGQLLGLAIVGSVFNNTLKDSLLKEFPSDRATVYNATTAQPLVHILQVTQKHELFKFFPESDQVLILDGFLKALHQTFYCTIVFCALSFIVSCFIQHKELKTNPTRTNAQPSKLTSETPLESV